MHYLFIYFLENATKKPFYITFILSTYLLIQGKNMVHQEKSTKYL